jgi:hypothetical protein
MTGCSRWFERVHERHHRKPHKMKSHPGRRAGTRYPPPRPSSDPHFPAPTNSSRLTARRGLVAAQRRGKIPVPQPLSKAVPALSSVPTSPQSQRDCVPEPRVGLRHAGLPWVSPTTPANPKGVASLAKPAPPSSLPLRLFKTRPGLRRSPPPYIGDTQHPLHQYLPKLNILSL